MRTSFFIAIFVGLLFMTQSALASHYNVTTIVSSFTIQSGNSTTGNFRVTPGVQPININLYTSSPFAMTLSDIQLDNMTTFKDFTYNISVPKYTLQGTYTSQICVVTNESICFNIVTVVPKLSDFTLNPDFNINVGSSTRGFFNLNFTNVGNSILSVFVNTSSSDISGTSFTAFPGFNYSVPISYVNTQKLGLVQYNITFVADNVTKYSFVNVTYTDVESPKLIDVKYTPEIKASLPFEIRVVAIDNINISNIQADFGFGLIYNFSKGFFVDNNTYNLTTNITNLEVRNFTLLITDTSNNNLTQTYNLRVSKLGGVKFLNYNPVELQQNFKYQLPIIYSDNPIDVTLKLTDFTLDPIVNNSMYIQGTGVDYKQVNANETIVLKRFQGRLNLEFSATNRTLFIGKIAVTVADYVSDNANISISGKVGDFNIFNAKNATVGDRTRTCNLKFTGDISNSTYVCEEAFPATTNFDDITISMTERERNEIVDKANLQNSINLGRYDTANIWRWIGWLGWILSMVIIGVVYILKTKKGFFMRAVIK